jgi:hypothetical protein
MYAGGIGLAIFGASIVRARGWLKSGVGQAPRATGWNGLRARRLRTTVRARRGWNRTRARRGPIPRRRGRTLTGCRLNPRPRRRGWSRSATKCNSKRARSTSSSSGRDPEPRYQFEHGFEYPRQRGRHVPAALRRSVFERDEGRCTYRSDSGERCRETAHLDLHHLVPFARGGEHRLDNVTLRCRAHNALAAEQDFGRDFVALARDSSQHETWVAYETVPCAWKATEPSQAQTKVLTVVDRPCELVPSHSSG